MIKTMIEHHDQLRFFIDPRIDESKTEKLYSRLCDFIDKFITFYSLSENQIISSYTRFLSRYAKDLRTFNKSGRYPFEMGFGNGFYEKNSISKIDYQLAMLMMTTMVYHRYRIMEIINTEMKSGEKLAVVGCGPGLEVHLVFDLFEAIDVYDLEFTEFNHSYFKDLIKINCHNCEFEEQVSKWDTVLLIEILEHVRDPFSLLSKTLSSLKSKGRIYCTTASNVPQFDHFYNFKNGEINSFALKNGLDIIFEEKIMHNSIVQLSSAENSFFILEKR